MEQEFEISFLVESAEPYHAYCEELDPLRVSVNGMIRRIYKDQSKQIIRITDEREEGQDISKVIYLDSKDDTPDEQLEKMVNESTPIPIKSSSFTQLEDLLELLNYRMSVRLVKSRTRYFFEGFHIDIDEYTEPESAVVVELEGDPKIAKKAYSRLLDSGIVPDDSHRE